MFEADFMQMLTATCEEVKPKNHLLIHSLFPEPEERHEKLDYENNHTQIFITEHELKAAASALQIQKPQAQMEYRQKFLKLLRKHISSY